MKGNSNLEKKESMPEPRRGDRRGGKERRIQLERKKSVAKVGMTLSMGALVATGLMRGRGSKILHIWSGVALVGLSAWHYNLYKPVHRENKV